MDKNEFLNILQGPSPLSDSEVDALKELIKAHPFSQLPRVLLAKHYYHTESPEKETYIQLAAAYVADRKSLKQFIQHQYTPSEPDLFEENTSAEHTQEFAPKPYLEAASVEDSTLGQEIEAQSNSFDGLSSADQYADSRQPEIHSNEEVITSQSPNNDSIDELVDEVNSNLEELRNLRTQYQDAQEEELRLEQQEDNSKDDNNNFTHPAFQNNELEVTVQAPEETIYDHRETASANASGEFEEHGVEEDEEPDPSSESSFIYNYLNKVGSEKEDTLENPLRKHQDELIEKFIKATPQMVKNARHSPSVEHQEDLAERSLKLDQELISENLAVIMAKQGKIEKAIDIYKKLIWKYPQKKVYFAARIEELKK